LFVGRANPGDEAGKRREWEQDRIKKSKKAES